MTEERVGILVFSLIALTSGAAWHSIVKKYLIASIMASVTTVILFQIAAYLRAGYLDPFYKIAIVFSAFIAIMASLVIGIPFLLHRDKKNKKEITNT